MEYCEGNSREYELEDVVDLGDDNTSEGITFHKDGSLYVTAYLNGKVFRFSHQVAEVVAKDLDGPAAIGFDSNGNLYVCEYGIDKAGKVTRITVDGRNEVLPTEADDGIGWFRQKKKRTIEHPNGMAVRSDGIVYVSSGRFVACIEENLASVLFSFPKWRPFHIMNGMALSEDQRTLYVNDALSGRIWKASLDASGRLSGVAKLKLKKRLWYADGIALDENECLYVTYKKKRLARIAPENGKVVDLYSGDELKTPANIAFGHGEAFDNRSIYITQLGNMELFGKIEPVASATVIKRIYVNVPGMVLPPLRWQ